jgi:glycosyltransferase involved in cell wall biosynthesis
MVTAPRSPLATPLQRTQRLSVIMPVYNEVATFKAVIDALLAKTIPGIEIEVILVESNSTDGTREKVLDYACHPRVHLILEERPQGKGHAVRAGLAAASGDFVLIQDADMEYDLDDYERLLEPLRTGEVGFVLGRRTSPEGSRGLRDFGQTGLTSRIMNLGHVLFLALFNTVYGQRLQDPFTMYKVIRRDCLHGLTFECDRFDFDWELTAKLIRAGYVPREIPVTYRSRSFKEGKKVSFFKDPLTWVRACLKYRFADLYPERPPAADDDDGDGSTPGVSGTPLSPLSEERNVELPVDATYPAEVGIRTE